MVELAIEYDPQPRSTPGRPLRRPPPVDLVQQTIGEGPALP